MSIITVLKNKKKTVEVVKSEDLKVSLEVNIDKEGVILSYEADQDGNIQVDDVKIKIDEFVHREITSYYKNLLQNQYSEIENIIVLSGAGSSCGVGVTNQGLVMSGLWDQFKIESKGTLEKLITETKHNAEIKDLELLLSNAGVHNIVNKKLDKEIEEVRKFIATKCTIELPKISPHAKFLNKIALRPQKFPRVKVFTLNYDTLFEQAAREEMFTVIDGFTFSSPREFNGKYFDYDIIETRHNRQDKKDSTIAKLFYLFKMHGSTSWKKEKGKIIQAEENSINTEDRVMIFPQDSKYEHSYEQPYFEMMARFQQALRLENTLLITIGFSFIDKHISSVVLESLKQNPSLNLMTFTFPEIIGKEKDFQKELHQIAEVQSRVTMIGEDFKNLAEEYPENIAHKRSDLISELNQHLRKITNKE